MLFLCGGATTLENFKVNEAQRHQAEGETRHDPSEEDKKARNPGIDEPPQRPELDILGIVYKVVRREHRPTKPQAQGSTYQR